MHDELLLKEEFESVELGKRGYRCKTAADDASDKDLNLTWWIDFLQDS